MTHTCLHCTRASQMCPNVSRALPQFRSETKSKEGQFKRGARHGCLAQPSIHDQCLANTQYSLSHAWLIALHPEVWDLLLCRWRLLRGGVQRRDDARDWDAPWPARSDVA